MISALEALLNANRQGEPRGIPSICSAHPWVLRAAARGAARSGGLLLVESTCNQVNQFGGYTGLTPADFCAGIRAITRAEGLPDERLLLGGDHLGPSVWQNRPAAEAMRLADELVRAYARAGYAKIHLDASMKLGGDPPGALNPAVAAQRTAELARACEQAAGQAGIQPPRYVIGTEVPVPGGAKEHEEGVAVTRVEAAAETIELTRRAFARAGVEAAWPRVLALVVQPGVEFGDDFVLPYDPPAARALSEFILTVPNLVYEAHSTDYQTRAALAGLTRDHFAILKVGPALTFAFREAVFALAAVEAELLPPGERSNLPDVLDDAMRRDPRHWRGYYHGDEAGARFFRRFSLSDRSRYYWAQPEVQAALDRLLANLSARAIPLALASQYLPLQSERIRAGELANDPAALLLERIQAVLADYDFACQG
jgi:D-tagatose-1,6-bisphosphate aldolase subunit GatZ/KbaZ